MTSLIPVKSPCVHVCILNNDDVCEGCYRTGMEISRWGRMDNAEKQLVLQACQQREQDSGNLMIFSVDQD
ncbi:DUF1289 domain-containing protein [Oceanobacter mangrovi]|uniref:DUF1289 domain-containing protein n=1 Tax=Oceanobacter mangrovi TaxID=2862510 RepID=UPI001C8D37C8